MAFELIDETKDNREEISEEKLLATRKARRMLDRAATERGMRWLIVQQLCIKLTGRCKGMNLSEYNKVIREIKNGTYSR